jgi:hypothetical protein
MIVRRSFTFRNMASVAVPVRHGVPVDDDIVRGKMPDVEAGRLSRDDAPEQRAARPAGAAPRDCSVSRFASPRWLPVMRLEMNRVHLPLVNRPERVALE